MMPDFLLDPRLEGDSLFVTRLGLSEVRLMKDGRWPWLLLIPRRPGASELHDLAPEDRAVLIEEIALAGAVMQRETGCLKVNTGALGNMVRQLHIHVIGRNDGDENWPGPVWGHGSAVPREAVELEAMAAAFRARLTPGGDV